MGALSTYGRRFTVGLVVAILLGTGFFLTFGRPSSNVPSFDDQTTSPLFDGNPAAAGLAKFGSIDAQVMRTTPCAAPSAGELSVEGLSVEGLSVEGLSVEGLSVEGLSVEKRPDIISERSNCYIVQVELVSGANAGQLYELQPLFSKHPTTSPFSPGQKILVRPVPLNDSITYEFVEHSRSGLLVAILTVGAAGLVLAGQVAGLRILAIGGATVAVLHLYALPAIGLTSGTNRLGTIALVSAVTILSIILVLDGPHMADSQTAFLGAIFTIALISGFGHIGSRVADLGAPLSTSTMSLNPLNVEPTAQAYLLLSLTVGTVLAASTICKHQVGLVQSHRALDPDADAVSMLTSSLNAGRGQALNMVGIFALASCASAVPLLAVFSSEQLSASQALNNELVASMVIRLTAGVLGLAIAAPIASALTIWMSPAISTSTPMRSKAPDTALAPADPALTVPDRSGQIHQPRPTIRRGTDQSQGGELQDTSEPQYTLQQLASSSEPRRNTTEASPASGQKDPTSRRSPGDAQSVDAMTGTGAQTPAQRASGNRRQPTRRFRQRSNVGNRLRGGLDDF